MAYYSGNTGSCKLNNQGIVGIQSWSLTINKEIPETTNLGDKYKTFQGTTYSSEGTVELLVLDGDTSQKLFWDNLKTTEEISDVLLFFDTGDHIKVDAIIVTSVDFGLGSNALGTATCNFIGTGAITFEGIG